MIPAEMSMARLEFGVARETDDALVGWVERKRNPTPAQRHVPNANKKSRHTYVPAPFLP
jgi:hypothetical protein